MRTCTHATTARSACVCSGAQLLSSFVLTHALKHTTKSIVLPCSAEAAIKTGSLPRLAGDLRGQLASLARTDYSGHALLQAKKQVRGSRLRLQLKPPGCICC